MMVIKMILVIRTMMIMIRQDYCEYKGKQKVLMAMTLMIMQDYGDYIGE